LKNRAAHIHAAKEKYDSYGDKWEKVYFDEKTGGFNVYHEDHKFSKKGGGGEAEKTVGKMLAKYNGKQVEFLPEINKKSPDFDFDSQKWDVKYVNNANHETIRSYIEDIRYKKANGIFYWEENDKFFELNKAIEREIGKLNKAGRIDEMPDIYYMDVNGLLKLLWGKQKGTF
jgi:hypothetical protein